MAQQLFNKRSYADQLADRLREAIDAGEWVAGDRLPPVRQLARRYEVGTRTVLQAIQRLEEQGVLLRQASGRVCVHGDVKPRLGGERWPALSGDVAREAVAHRRQGKGLAHIGILGASAALTPNGYDDWTARICIAAESQLKTLGGFCSTRIYADSRPLQGGLAPLLEQIERMADQLQGVILMPALAADMRKQMDLCDRLGLPWVSINPLDDVVYNFVSTDNFASGRIAGNLFRAKGLERVAVLGMKLWHRYSWRQKVMGVYESYLMAGQPTTGIHYLECPTSVGREVGYETMRAFLRDNPPPQGIFGTGDSLCHGAMQACMEHGLRVPQDVSVLGSTGDAYLSIISPSMSAIAQPMDRIGRSAVDMLVRMMQTGERRLPGVQLPNEVTLRDSFTLSEEERQRLDEPELVFMAGAGNH